MSTIDGVPGESRTTPTPLSVRPARPADRPALLALGHPPAVVQALVPSIARRLTWTLSGARLSTLLAQEGRDGAVLGSVQFIRAWRRSGTWMFGYWRVTSGRRRQGIGGLLLRQGVGLLPGLHHLFSHVDWGNDVSSLAHQRLGFEAGDRIWGSASLGALSTIGAAAPAVRLEEVARSRWRELFPIYLKAMGDLWPRLFPGLGENDFLTTQAAEAPPSPAAGLAPGLVVPLSLWTVHPDRAVAGFVLARGSAVTLYADPAACDAPLLARVAIRLIGMGMPRGRTIALRGLPRDLAGRSGPITARTLMGMPDAERLLEGAGLAPRSSRRRRELMQAPSASPERRSPHGPPWRRR
ncbi:MAG TPA: GNAT family N-acetyltransferase [Candidatus Polarisedimenticolia bacterium]|nr:GNAT family N-acetyltransferase [Candidatus Polarisedimenticolia bacterium]